MFVFGDFNVHYKDWLAYSGETGRPDELCYIFSSQMTLLRWLTFPLESLTVILTILFFRISFFLLMVVFSHCSTVAFPPLGNSYYVVVSVSIDFLSNSKGDASFDRIAHDYSCSDWGSLRDHLRDVLWEDL